MIKEKSDAPFQRPSEEKRCIGVKSYWKDLKSEFAAYNAGKFAKDLMAGVTVAVVALPLALAFGVGGAAAGLLTAVICGFVISLLGGAFYQISGPTGAMAAILMSIVAQYGMSGVFAAAVLAGILLILAGVFHLGRVTAYLPMPVITGFTSGIAVVIALGQVGNFFGYSLQREYRSGKTARLADGRHLPNQSRRAGARVFCGAVHGVLSEALEQ